MLLLLDNYDSFTYNLAHYLGELGAEVDVRRNDALSAEAVIKLNPSHIVLSPGPARPEQAGILIDLIRLASEHRIPLFGVCLGHQGIGHAFGGKVILAPSPMHGKISKVHHMEDSVFRGLPASFDVTRYHSLIVEKHSLPKDLVVTAETEDGIIMGLKHSTFPVHGVQFHPESIATENGHALIKNFLAFT